MPPFKIPHFMAKKSHFFTYRHPRVENPKIIQKPLIAVIKSLYLRKASIRRICPKLNILLINFITCKNIVRSFDLFSNSISHLASKKFWVFMFFLFVLGLWFSVFCIYQWIIDPTPPLRALIMFVVRIYWCPAKKKIKKNLGFKPK